MLKEIVHTILPRAPGKKDCKTKQKKPDSRNGEVIERRNEPKQSNKTLDNAKTHKIKIKLNTQKYSRIPVLYSFLIFYVCVINVIIMCDVSINNVNIKTFKETRKAHELHTFREKSKPWRGHKYEDKAWHGKNYRKGRASQRDTDEEKTDKYTVPEVQEYYDYYKNKDDINNATEKPYYFPIRKYDYDDSMAVGYPHDLASKPYYVKKTNFNLRPERHEFHKKIVKLGVLLPADPNQVFSLVKVLPILEMAVPAVTKPDGPLPGWKILVDYRDTGCSSVEGPLAAFEFYVNGSAGKFLIFFSQYIYAKIFFVSFSLIRRTSFNHAVLFLDAFIGPGCEYVIAPVARYAGPWGIPVITAGAQAQAFSYKHPSYATLTRMMGSYIQAGVAIRKVFEVIH